MGMSDSRGGEQREGVAALIRRFTANEKLGDEELRRLAEYLPPRLLGSAGLRLRGRDVYSKPRSIYAEIYGQSVRGINKWIERGLRADPADAPPLDDPEQMIGWWGRHMKHRVPDHLYEAVRKAKSEIVPRGTTLSVPAVTEAAQAAPDPAREMPTDAAAVLSTGFLASLLRTREEEAQAHRRYREAVAEDPPDEGKIRVCMHTWKDLAEHLRALEKAAPDVLKKTGDMWLAVDIVSELTTIHGAIINGVESLWRRFSVKIGIQSDERIDRLWQEECARLFKGLLESKFVSPEARAADQVMRPHE